MSAGDPVGVLPPYQYEQPLFGAFGQIATVGERLVCHLCGRDFLDLGTHVRRTHGVDAFEYKRLYGLMRRTPLKAASMVRRQRETAKRTKLGHNNGTTRERLNELRRMAIEAVKNDPRMERDQKLRATIQAAARRRWGVPETLPTEMCGKGHVWDGFRSRGGHARNSKLGLQRRCRQCNRDNVKRWRKEQPEKWHAMKKRARERKRASGSEIGSETPDSRLPTHESHNTAGIGTGVDERA